MNYKKERASKSNNSLTNYLDKVQKMSAKQRVDKNQINFYA